MRTSNPLNLNLANTHSIQFYGDNVIDKLYDYYIKESSGNPIPFGCREFFSVFLECFGATAGIYAWPPAWAYSKNKSPFLAYSITITNPISNTLFLVKAMDDLFDSITLESSLPAELSAHLDRIPTKELIIKYSKMFIGSFVCAIPFGISTYLYPLPGCDKAWSIGLIVIHSTIANMILHAISLNFLLTPQLWYYRLPILPLEWLYKSLCKNNQDNTEQKKIYQKYKSILIDQFSIAINKRMHNHLSANSNAFNNVTDARSNVLTFFERNSNSAVNNSQITHPHCLTTIKAAGRNLASILGALYIMAGCIGWIGSPIYICMTLKLGLYASIALGGLPSYTTAVLCAFYGSETFKQVYDFLTNWSDGLKDKFSFESRLYPKSFFIYLLFNIYVSAFSFGTGVELAEHIFSDAMWDKYRPSYRNYIIIPALIILSFVPLLNLFNAIVRKFTAKFGSNSENRTGERLLIKLGILTERIKQIKGEHLMNALSEYSEQQLAFLGINVNNFKSDRELLSAMPTSNAKNRNTFFKASDETRLLLENGHPSLSINP